MSVSYGCPTQEQLSSLPVADNERTLSNRLVVHTFLGLLARILTIFCYSCGPWCWLLLSISFICELVCDICYVFGTSSGNWSHSRSTVSTKSLLDNLYTRMCGTWNKKEGGFAGFHKSMHEQCVQIVRTSTTPNKIFKLSTAAAEPQETKIKI